MFYMEVYGSPGTMILLGYGSPGTMILLGFFLKFFGKIVYNETLILK